MPNQSPRGITTSGPQTQRKRPGDLTGVNSQKLAAERDEVQEAAIADAAALKQEDRSAKMSTVVDYTEPGSGQAAAQQAVEQVETPLEPEDPFMLIRVNYPIEQMTFGREVVSPAVLDPDTGAVLQPAVLGGMNVYNFEEGQQYRVARDLGAHLKSLGYVYDF